MSGGKAREFVALCARCNDMPISDVAYVCTSYACRRDRGFPFALCEPCMSEVQVKEEATCHALVKKLYAESTYTSKYKDKWVATTDNGKS